MAVIEKVANKASASRALIYALGKNKELKNETKDWVVEKGIDRPNELENTRAFIVNGTNGLDPMNAVQMFRDNRRQARQTQNKNQALTLIQSFGTDELDPTSFNDRQLANDIGLELAEKVFPGYQAGIYTHIDGKNHAIHNHIVVDKVSLNDGKKMQFRKGQLVDRLRNENDNLAKQYGLRVLEPKKDRVTSAESGLRAKNQRVWKDDFKEVLDTVINFEKPKNFEEYLEKLENYNINYKARGKGGTYSFERFNKQGKLSETKIRESTLGEDYKREAIDYELQNREATESRESETTSEQRGINPIVIETERIIESSRSSGERAENEAEKCKEDFEQSIPLFEQLKTTIANSIKDFAEWTLRKSREIRERREQSKRATKQAELAKREDEEAILKVDDDNFERWLEQGDETEEDAKLKEIDDMFEDLLEDNPPIESEPKTSDKDHTPPEPEREEYEGPEL